MGKSSSSLSSSSGMEGDTPKSEVVGIDVADVISLPGLDELLEIVDIVVRGNLDRECVGCCLSINKTD